MNIDSQVSLCSDKNFIVNILAKDPFFAKMLAVPFYEGTDKQTFRANVYCCKAFLCKRISGRMSTPPSHAPGCYQSALIGLLDLLTFVRNTKSPIWPKEIAFAFIFIFRSPPPLDGVCALHSGLLSYTVWNNLRAWALPLPIMNTGVKVKVMRPW